MLFFDSSHEGKRSEGNFILAEFHPWKSPSENPTGASSYHFEREFGAVNQRSLLGEFANFGTFLSVFIPLNSFFQSDWLNIHKEKRTWMLVFRHSKEKESYSF